jgi:hypothetical protein
MESIRFVPVFDIEITDKDILDYYAQTGITYISRNKDGSLNMRRKENKDAKEFLFFSRKSELMKQYYDLIEEKKQDKMREACSFRVDTSKMEMCPICMEDMKGRAILDCTHTFCIQCSIQHFRNRTNCPLCRAEVCEKPVGKFVPGNLIQGIVNENLSDIYEERLNTDLYNYILTTAGMFKDGNIDVHIFTRNLFEEVSQFGYEVGESVRQWFES